MAELATLVIKVDSSSMGKAQAEMEGLGNKAGWLEKAITGLMAAFAVYKIADFTKEVTQLAARFDTMEVVMDRAGNNAGYTGRQMRELETALQATGISMLESRNALTQLATAHIDLSHATDMARGAQDLAVVAGINSSEAFGRLVQGIKSGQTETLRTLGLNVQFEEGYKRLAKEVGKTTSELSGQEKMNARVAETMKELANYEGIYEDAMNTAGKQAKSLERYMENLEVQLGRVFQPIYSQMILATTETLKGMSEWLSKNANKVDALANSMGTAYAQFMNLIKAVAGGKSSFDWLGWAREVMDGLGLAIAYVHDGFMGWKLAISEVGSFIFMKLAEWAQLFARFYEMMPGGAESAKLARDFVIDLAAVSAQYKGQADEARNATSAVEAWDEAYYESIRIAKEGKEAFDGPSRLDMLGKVQVPEVPEVKENKAFTSLIDGLKEQIATFGMGKTAIDAYKASLMGLTKSQEGEVKGLLNQVDALNWEQQRVDDARKAENDLTEALEKQSKARIDLLYQQRMQLEEEGRRLSEQMQSPDEKRTADLQKLDAMLRGHVISMETYNRKLQEIERNGLGAFSTLLNAVDLFAQHGADAFTQFAMTGKFVWKDMINSIIADLIRLQSQKAFVQLGGYLLGMIGAGTSVPNNGDYWSGLPTGGGGTPTPEGGSWTPGVAAGLGGGSKAFGAAPATGGVQNSITVIVQDGKTSTETKSSGEQGAEIGRSLEAHMNVWAAKEMRPGGILNPIGA